VYCSRCGTELVANATFCSACGNLLSGPATSAPVAAPAAISPVYPGSAVPAPYGTREIYAGFWLRFVAYLIDGFISGIAFVLLLIPLFILTGAGAWFSRLGAGEEMGDDTAVALVFGVIAGIIGIVLLVSWLYYAYSESSSWQATVGKKILNLKVTDMAGQPISFGRASGRFFARIITRLIPLGIGYIMAGFTEKKQAIHDMIAGCLVLRKD
jgi:uncharacterized RDD family membrane protein YckC